VWLVPTLATVVRLQSMFTDGISNRLTPLFLTADLGMTPRTQLAMDLALALLASFGASANPWMTHRIGRTAYMAVLLVVTPPLLLVFLNMPSLAPAVAVSLFRNALQVSLGPLIQGVIADIVPPAHRGKFTAFQGVNFMRSAFLFIGTELSDHYHSYRPAFVVTALLQATCLPVFAAVVMLMPRGQGSDV